jgi:hypothetical protein
MSEGTGRGGKGEQQEYTDARDNHAFDSTGYRPLDAQRETGQDVFMHTLEATPLLTRLFSELVDGPPAGGDAFMLNSGDRGLLRSLERIPAADASRAVNDGATIAAHAQHLRYGLSLMNRWAAEGGNPFADATWDAAWKTSRVDETSWREIRDGLRDEAHRWRKALASPREVTEAEFMGVVGSIAHLAYHLGAIRQINKAARGPREGTFE